MREFPFSVDNPECNIFIRRSSAELQNHSVVIARLLDDLICRGFRLVDKIWVEYIELVSLNHLRGRVVGAMVWISIRLLLGEGDGLLVVRLVVLVPLVSRVNTVEVPWLPGPVLVLPIVRRWVR